MDNHNSKEVERFLLLSRIFPPSYPGHPLEENLLFKLCRELRSDYCLAFNETGYDDKYKGFESEQVKKEVVKLISDQELTDFLKQNQGKCNENDFNGEHYTFYGKEKRFEADSRWDEFRKLINEFLDEFEVLGTAVLAAILELNEQGRRYKNYYEILSLAMRKGFTKGVKGRGYNTLLSELEVSKIIAFGKKDLHIPEELMPLV